MGENRLYVVYGGCLNKGTVKIGKTTDIDASMAQYKTYYGKDVKCSSCISDNLDADEEKLKRILTQCNLSGELFKVRVSRVKIRIKGITGKNRMNIYKFPNGA